MSVAISIDVVSNRFPEIGSKMHRHVVDSVGWALTQTHAIATPITPVDTGALRSNVSVNHSGESGTVNWNQHYAIYVHEGTYKMAARPFARTAAMAVQGPFLARLATLGI